MTMELVTYALVMAASVNENVESIYNGEDKGRTPPPRGERSAVYIARKRAGLNRVFLTYGDTFHTMEGFLARVCKMNVEYIKSICWSTRTLVI